MLKNSKIKIVSIVPRLQAQLVSVMPSYSMPKLVNVKANSIGHGIKPTFTRTSTAYKSDGTVVSAGVPRIEADKGVLVEEGTVNLILLSSLQADTEVYTLNKISNGLELYEKRIFWYAEFTNKFNVNQSIAYTLTFVRNVILQADVPIVESILFYNASDVYLGEIGTTISYTDGLKTLSFTTPAGCAYVKLRLMRKQAVASSLCAYRYTNIQLEAKPYPTTFHPSTRSPESLTIPASVLHASEGTIEFDVYITDTHKAAQTGYRFFIRAKNASSWTHYIGIPGTTAYIMCGTNNGINSSGILKYLNTITVGKHRMAMSYKSTKLSFYFDGVLVNSVINPYLASVITQIDFGSNGDGNQANTYYSNLRISNKARSDAELANTGALTVDEWTTYFAELTSDLSAYQKGNGNTVLKSIAC